MRLFATVMATILLAGLLPSVSHAQSDPRFAEAIAAVEDWDRDKARALLKAACNEKVVGACARLLSLHYEDNEDDAQRVLAAELCEFGDAYACYFAGQLTHWGEGASEEKALARAHYQAACDGNLPMGCVSLAEMLKNGEGGPEDTEKAITIYLMGCEKKHGPACFGAADLIESSIWTGETRDDTEVAELEAQVRTLYEQACDNSDPEGCLQLAKGLREGTGGDKEPERALQLMMDTCAIHKRACEQVIRLRFYQP